MCFGTASLFCLCDLIWDIFCRSFGHALWQFVRQTDVAVVDAHFLRCCSGVLLRTRSDFHPLDEDVQDLRGQLLDLAVPLGVLNEPCDVGAGILQFLKPRFHGGELLLNLFLLGGVLLREDAVLLVRDAAKNTVLVEPLEQLRQFILQLLHGVDFLLEHDDLPLCFLALFLSDALRKAQFVLAGEVCDAADVIQNDGVEFLFPDVVTGAYSATHYSVKKNKQHRFVKSTKITMVILVGQMVQEYNGIV